MERNTPLDEPLLNVYQDLEEASIGTSSREKDPQLKRFRTINQNLDTFSFDTSR